MASGAVFQGITKLDTSGMRAGFARLRRMNAEAARSMNAVNGGRRGMSQPLSGLDRSINSVRNSLARTQSVLTNNLKMVSFYGTRIKKDVLVPLTQATRAATAFAKRAALAGAAFASFGVYRNFKIEGMTEQFAVLMKNSRQARRMMRDLMNEAAVSPFGLEDYIGSVRMLYTIGGRELSNKNFIRMMGDAAAVTGKDMQQVASWTAKLYQSLKSGAGVGTSGDDMLRAGLLTAETYAYMKSHGKTVGNFSDVWARGVKDLSRFAGGMDRIRYTGQGAFNMLKGLSALGMQDLFAGFTKSVKNVMYNMTTLLKTLRQTGQFKSWGKEIGETASDAVNGIYRLIQSYSSLDEQSRASVNNVLKVMGTLGGMQYTGILAPLVKAATGAAGILMSIVTRATLFTLSNFAAIIKGGSLVGMAIQGFKWGNDIYDNLSGWGNKIVELFALIGFNMGKMLLEGFRVMNPMEQLSNMLKAGADAYINDENYFTALWKRAKPNTDVFKSAAQEIRNGVDGVLNSTGEQALSGQEAAGKKWTGKLEDLKNKVQKDILDTVAKIKGLKLDDVLKLPGMEGMKKWLEEFKKLPKIKLPQMPKPPDLNGQVRQANQIAQIMGKVHAYTSRGWYFQWIKMSTILAAAKNAGRIANHDPASEKQRRGLGTIEKNTGKTNAILEDIRRNTAKQQTAVYA